VDTYPWELKPGEEMEKNDVCCLKLSFSEKKKVSFFRVNYCRKAFKDTLLIKNCEWRRNIFGKYFIKLEGETYRIYFVDEDNFYIYYYAETYKTYFTRII